MRYKIKCASASVTLLLIFSFTVSSQNIEYFSPRNDAIFVSPKTNIIIRPGEILDRSSIHTPMLLNVAGSVSGRHSGTIELSDDEKTLLFQPDRDFTLGERIQVELLRGLKTRKGNTVDPFIFSFTITPRSPVDRNRTTVIFPDVKSNVMQESGTNQARKMKMQSHQQGSDFPPDFPLFDLSVINNPAPGALFLSIQSIKGIAFLAIIGDSGKMVFCRQMKEWCYDFKMQPNGLLTYFDNVPGYYYALDSSYAVVDSFKCGNGYLTDMHDLQLLPNNHALLIGLDEQTIDMSQIVDGGLKDAQVTGLIIQEIDRDKRVVFEWRSWDHFKITDAMNVDLKQHTINYVWGNSVEQDHDGNILLSSRYLSEVTKIDRQTGEIIWRLGGKNNQFVFINDPVGFISQHDARRLPNGNITLFDNGDKSHQPYSRAVEYKLDEMNKTATLVWQFQHTPSLLAGVCGNAQRLPNGNTVIGWGNAMATSMTEVQPDGVKVLELRFRDDFVYSYRVFKFLWKNNLTSVTDSPAQFSLIRNYPNPFGTATLSGNPATTIQFSLPSAQKIKLVILDINGNEIISLFNGELNSGQHSFVFEARDLPSGTYYVELLSPTSAHVKAMNLIK